MVLSSDREWQMAYFLKRTRNKKGLYLQIYESHWDPKRRHTANRSVKTLSAKERTWALSGDGWTDVPDGKGETSFRYKVADGDFRYTFVDEGGRRRKVELLERRVVTYSPSLARKQTYEISQQVEKARALKATAAKRSDYGDSAKYVTYSPVDAEGELRKDMKVAATLNHEAIRKAKALAGYSMIVTSETRMDPPRHIQHLPQALEDRGELQGDEVRARCEACLSSEAEHDIGPLPRVLHRRTAHETPAGEGAGR
jgi:hypothetical protein